MGGCSEHDSSALLNVDSKAGIKKHSTRVNTEAFLIEVLVCLQACECAAAAESHLHFVWCLSVTLSHIK